MAAFDVSGNHFDCPPNHRMFYKYFMISRNPGDDPCGLHSFSSKQNQVFLSGVLSKLNFFKQRWCWVSGPGIISNPPWRKPVSVLTVEYFDADVKVSAKIAEFLKKGKVCVIKSMIVPELLRISGLVSGPVPDDADDADDADAPEAAAVVLETVPPSSLKAASPTHSHDTIDSLFDHLTPNPDVPSSQHPTSLQSSPAAYSETGAFSPPWDDDFGEIHLDTGHDVAARGFDDPLPPSFEGIDVDAPVEAEAPGYYFCFSFLYLSYSFCVFCFLICHL
ncbi:hypothetical protein Dimus_039292 [Dionaea muscipula]